MHFPFEQFTTPENTSLKHPESSINQLTFPGKPIFQNSMLHPMCYHVGACKTREIKKRRRGRRNMQGNKSSLAPRQPIQSPKAITNPNVVRYHPSRSHHLPPSNLPLSERAKPSKPPRYIKMRVMTRLQTYPSHHVPRQHPFTFSR